MRKNKAKEIIKAGKAVINGWLQIPSTVSAETMAQQGWDTLTTVSYTHLTLPTTPYV